MRRILREYLMHSTNRCAVFWMHFWHVLMYFSNFLVHLTILGYLLEKGAKKLRDCATKLVHFGAKVSIGTPQKNVKFQAPP